MFPAYRVRTVANVVRVKRPLWRLLWRNWREAAFDVALVLGLQLLGRILVALFPRQSPPEAYAWIGGEWASDVLMMLLCLGLLVRRRFPLTLMVLTALISAAQVLLIEFGPGPLLVINQLSDPWPPGLSAFAIYAAVVYTRGRRRWLFALNLVSIVTLLSARPWERPEGDTLVTSVVLTIFPLLLGLYVRARRRLVDALRGRAERAERERELLAEQARAEERARLAAEMHDVVTHRVSLMVLQAGALEVAAADPETRRAAGELRAGGCEALGELRDLVGVLRSGREGPAEEPPIPTVAVPDLSELLQQSEAVGVPVDFAVEGDPALVTGAVARTAYRVVQEALTNVHKHAYGADVAVRIVYGGDRVRLSVRNSAPARLSEAAAELAASGSGAGLLGLQQRVELVGGEFHAGPVATGGFEVDAVLPAYVPTGEVTAGG